MEYGENRKRQNQEIVTRIEGVKEAIAQALWDVDNRTLNILLKGLRSSKDFSGLDLKDDTGTNLFHDGEFHDDSLVSNFELFYQEKKVGTLSAIPNITELQNHALLRFVVVLITNSIKALLVSLILFMFLDRVVSRRIEAIRKYLMAAKQRFALDHFSNTEESQIKVGDEITDLNSHARLLVKGIEDGQKQMKLLNLNLQEIVQTQVDEIIGHKQKLADSQRLVDIGVMAAGIAHEINNPLAIIKGNVDQIIRIEAKNKEALTSPEDSQKIGKALQTISKTCSRIHKIVNMMRQLSREAHRDPFLEEDIVALVEEVAEFCEARMGKENIKWQSDFKGASKLLSCQKVGIFQILVNLISNAIDAIVDSNTQGRWIKVSLVDQNDHLAIVVSNGGPTISEDVRKKIMTPFFTTKDPSKGTGLGLALCNRIADAHGAKFYLDSEAENTSFVLEFKKVGYHGVENN